MIEKKIKFSFLLIICLLVSSISFSQIKPVAKSNENQSSETNVKPVAKSNENQSSETNVKPVAKSNENQSSETNVKPVAKSNENQSSETNVKPVAKSNENQSSETNVKPVAKSNENQSSETKSKSNKKQKTKSKSKTNTKSNQKQNSQTQTTTSTKPTTQQSTSSTKPTTASSSVNQNRTILGGVSPINVNIKETYQKDGCYSINHTVYEWSDGKLVDVKFYKSGRKLTSCYKPSLQKFVEPYYERNKIFYDKNNRIERIEVSPSGKLSKYNRIFSYENDKLIKITESYINDLIKNPDYHVTHTNQMTFNYQGGKLSDAVLILKESSVASGTIIKEYKMAFVWEGDNVKKITKTELYKTEGISRTTTYVWEYTYDNKLNPYYGIYDGDQLPGVKELSKNNSVSVKSSNSIDNIVSTTETGYEYNGNNIPTKIGSYFIEY